MENSNKKITVGWDELDIPKAEKIVLGDLGGRSEKESIKAAVPSPPTAPSVPAAGPILLFSSSAWRRWMIIASAILATAIVLGAFVGLRSKGDWIQAIGKSAGKSVVWLETTQAMGTGFVIASRGGRHLILTNRHVLTVEQGIIFTTESVPPECRVVLQSHESLVGHVVGRPYDSRTDLSLVLVETPRLQPVRIRRFADVTVGERVVAVGHPEGLEFSLTEGIVSAKRGSVWLQTSAAINPGNSGGPLFDQEGYVIGVNTLKINDSQGLGLSLRADLVFDHQLWQIDPIASDLLNCVNQ